MSGSRVLTAAVLVALFVSVGCAKPPQAEIDLAREALTGAEGAQAEKWAGPEHDEAKAALAALDTELAGQEGKLGLLRNYEAAKELAAQAEQRATAAREAAVRNKEAARDAAAGALEGVAATLASTRDLAVQIQGCPRKPKGFDADMAVMTGGIDALAGELSVIEGAIAAEDFDGARAQAGSLEVQLQTIAADLVGAMEKIKCSPAT